jgi:cysteine synthase A
MRKEDLNHRIRWLTHLVGNSPLLAVEFEFRGRPRVIYAKAENLNMTGSIKDRMALHILLKGYARADLKPADLIVEATSGNTGISFAAIGRALGHPVTIFMPDWMSQERIGLIRSFGAKINLVRQEDGGFLGSIRQAEELARSTERAFLPRQFSNEDNVDAHERHTGPEIWWQLKFRGMAPHAFVAGVGTGGTVMGVGKFLREKDPEVKIHPLEPASSPTLSTGRKVGKHRIQGISDEFIPAIVDLGSLDPVVGVDDGDAILMAQKLSSDLGLGVGISSGANFIGAMMLQNEMGEDAVVATVFPDDNKKYLSTDLFGEEPVKEGFLTPDVRLTGFRAFKRVCHLCCDPTLCTEATRAVVTEEGETIPYCPRKAPAES